MTTITMSLYDALSKVKTMKASVDRLSSCSQMAIIRKKYLNETESGYDLNEAEKKIQSSYDSTFALIHNYYALKAAINDANAKTTVTIGGVEYSIANLIVRYRGLRKEMELYNTVMRMYNDVKSEVERKNDKILNPDTISRYINNMIGGNGKPQADMIETLERNYKNNNVLDIYDPLNIFDLITKKLNEINEILDRYHSALTQVNVNTMITVDFE